MKKALAVLAFSIQFLFTQAQAPQSFSYQAVARDLSGNVLGQQNVSFRISILQGSVVGTTVYSESHNVTTNDFGLANLKIGLGTVISGTFSTIQWAGNNFFIKVEMDASGGTAYQLMGTTQLLSVPYALHAQSAASVSSLGQNAYQATGTGQLSVTSGVTTYTLIPGLSLNITIPANAKVIVHTDGGIQCTATGNAYSIVDVGIAVDGTIQTERRIVAANTTGLAQVIENWSMDRVLTLSAGAHTFQVKAVYPTGTGASTANVSSGSAPQLQGTLTVTVIGL